MLLDRAEHLCATGPKQARCILVSSYVYACAQVLLSSLTEAHREGPYIISTTAPLSGLSKLPLQYLFQDLSSVPPQLISLWIKEFIKQAGEREFWKTRTKEEFVLRLRTSIGVMANQVPDFANSITWTFATLNTH